jgi:regulation of enolase protein 1 (concanavalin A-like superfamily)
MPAHDVTITGSFAANSYNLIYMVDGTEYKRTSLSYGSAITPEPAPTKEGYAFSGWSTIPATMPAHDVTITGSFAANSYNLIYMVDGTEYKRTSLAYGSAITPEPAPTKEGYAFSGWSTIPATMPAHDVTITGTFNVNYYTITYKVDGIIYKTVSVAYGSILTPEPAPTKEGYVFSGWSTIPETMPANDIEVTGSFIVSGIKEISSNSFVNVYNLEGKRIKSHIDVNALKEILPTGVYIVNGKKYCIIHD